MRKKKSKNPLTGLVSQNVVSEDHQLRRAFYNGVLGATPPVRPEEDLQRLCSDWLDATGAQWVWLWLKHESGNNDSPWELTAAVGKEGYTEDLVPAEFRNVALEDRQSVAEYCTQIEKPVFVDDVVNWDRELQGKHYRVVSVSELLKRKCRSFLAVPLFFPTSGLGDLQAPPFSLRGLVCSHFLNHMPAKPLQSEESYLLMGRATSQAIAASFAAEQYRILIQMDALATQFLTSHEGNPVTKRQVYLARVIDLVKEHLRVQYVSVFYRSRDRTQLECLASTGLSDSSGDLPSSRLGEARYKRGEGVTGLVFVTGVPFISQIGHAPQRPGQSGYKWRETPRDVPETQLPWFCYPIIAADSHQAREVLGALRCVGNQSLLAKAKPFPRNFDPIQLQTLDFIARQLAPVLETMALQIERERNITIIKHDLFNPIRMIDTQVEAVHEKLTQGKLASKYWLSNIRAALLLARNLAGSLSEQQAFRPQPTLIEGDIVARLKDGLSYFAWLENRVKIEFEDIRTVLPRLNVDRDLIERAITNLLINAIKYSYTDTTITVYSKEATSDYLLHVENFGIGIQHAEADRIFEGDYRSPRVVSLKQGLGLGLKIARAAMRRHGGDLVLTSLKNPTTFTLVFPKRLATSTRER